MRIDIDKKSQVHFYDDDGNECRVATYPIHEARWWALTVWIAIFTVVVILLGVDNRQAIHDLEKQKANVAQLQRTNAVLARTVSHLKTTNQSLRNFLLQACIVRANAARHETGEKRANDIRAAKGYQRLASLFPDLARAKLVCKIPQ
jgi:cell division protein FtsB